MVSTMLTEEGRLAMEGRLAVEGGPGVEGRLTAGGWVVGSRGSTAPALDAVRTRATKSHGSHLGDIRTPAIVVGAVGEGRLFCGMLQPSERGFPQQPWMLRTVVSVTAGVSPL
jgi:hypothetical protein